MKKGNLSDDDASVYKYVLKTKVNWFFDTFSEFITILQGIINVCKYEIYRI